MSIYYIGFLYRCSCIKKSRFVEGMYGAVLFSKRTIMTDETNVDEVAEVATPEATEEVKEEVAETPEVEATEEEVAA